MLLRKRAEDILAMVDKTSEEFKALGQVTGGDIHIGCAESENIKHLARRIKAVREQCPGIRFHLYSGDTNDLAERLDRGLLDFVVIAEAVDLSKYNYLEFPGADIWGVVMRKDAPLAKKKSIRIHDLLDQPLAGRHQPGERAVFPPPDPQAGDKTVPDLEKISGIHSGGGAVSGRIEGPLHSRRIRMNGPPPAQTLRRRLFVPCCVILKTNNTI